MFEIPNPDDIQIVGPHDQSPVWWHVEPNGRCAVVIGRIDDGGIAFAGSPEQLLNFAAKLHLAVATWATARSATSHPKGWQDRHAR